MFSSFEVGIGSSASETTYRHNLAELSDLR